MRVLCTLVLACFCGFTVNAEEPKPSKTVNDLFPNFKGTWFAEDEKASKLESFQFAKYEKKPDKFPTEWHVGFVVQAGNGKNYYGPAEKVEVVGDTLKITLPPTGKVDEKRTTFSLIVKRVDKNLEVELLDGDFKGKYTLRISMPRKD